MAGRVLDLIEGLVKSGLLLFLCKDMIALKEKYRSTGKVLFFLQIFLMSHWLSHSAWVEKMIYGNTAGQMNNSSYSIVKIVVLLFSSFIAMDILYQGRRQAKAYILLVFYTVQEMSRFICHSIWMLAIDGYLAYLNEQILTQMMDVEQFMVRVEWMQFLSLLLFGRVIWG